jgi:hypothetical protein
VLQSRGRTWRLPGYLALQDVMSTVNATIR